MTITHDALYRPPSQPPTGHGTSLYEDPPPQTPAPPPDTGPFCIGTPDPGPLQTWDLTVQGHFPLLVTSRGHLWRPVQTCSLQDPPVLISGGY